MIQVADTVKNVAENLRQAAAMREKSAEMARAALTLSLTAPDAPLRKTYDDAKQKLSEGIDSLGQGLVTELNRAVDGGSFQRAVVKATDFGVDYRYTKKVKEGDTPVTVLVEALRQEKKAVVRRMQVTRGNMGKGGEFETTEIYLGSGNDQEPFLNRAARKRRKEYSPKGREVVVDMYTSEEGIGTAAVRTNLTRGIPLKDAEHKVISFGATKTFGEGWGDNRAKNSVGADEVVVRVGDLMEEGTLPGSRKLKVLTASELREGERTEARYFRKGNWEGVYKPGSKDSQQKPIDVSYVGGMAIKGEIFGSFSDSGHDPLVIETRSGRVSIPQEDFRIFKDIHIPTVLGDTSSMPLPTVPGLIGK